MSRRYQAHPRLVQARPSQAVGCAETVACVVFVLGVVATLVLLG